MGNTCCGNSAHAAVTEMGQLGPQFDEIRFHLKQMNEKIKINRKSLIDFKILLTESQKELQSDSTHSHYQAHISRMMEGLKELQQEYSTLEDKEYRLEQQTSRMGKILARHNSQQIGTYETPGKPQDDEITIKNINAVAQELKHLEDKSQAFMLRWQNYIIRQEKIKKHRDQIKDVLSTSQLKMKTIDEMHLKFTDNINFFTQVLPVISSCQQNTHFDLPDDVDQETSDFFGTSFDDELKTSEVNERNDIEILVKQSKKLDDNFQEQIELQRIKLKLFQEQEQEITQLSSTELEDLDVFYSKLQFFLNSYETIIYRLSSQLTELESHRFGNPLFDLVDNQISKEDQLSLTTNLIDRYCELYEMLKDVEEPQVGICGPNMVLRFRDQIDGLRRGLDGIQVGEDLKTIKTLSAVLSGSQEIIQQIVPDIDKIFVQSIQAQPTIDIFGVRDNLIDIITNQKEELGHTMEKMKDICLLIEELIEPTPGVQSEQLHVAARQLQIQAEIVQKTLREQKSIWNGLVDEVDKYEQSCQQQTIIVSEDPEKVNITIELNQAIEKVKFYQQRLMMAFTKTVRQTNKLKLMRYLAVLNQNSINIDQQVNKLSLSLHSTQEQAIKMLKTLESMSGMQFGSLGIGADPIYHVKEKMIKLREIGVQLMEQQRNQEDLKQKLNTLKKQIKNIQGAAGQQRRIMESQDEVNKLEASFDDLKSKQMSQLNNLQGLAVDIQQDTKFLQKICQIQKIDLTKPHISRQNTQELSMDSDLYPQVNKHDNVDSVFQKYLSQMKIFRSMVISKEGDSKFKIETKVYKFKLIGSEKQLAICMEAGLIFADSLVHYAEELESIVRQ